MHEINRVAAFLMKKAPLHFSNARAHLIWSVPACRLWR